MAAPVYFNVINGTLEIGQEKKICSGAHDLQCGNVLEFMILPGTADPVNPVEFTITGKQVNPIHIEGEWE